jgi:DNA-binding cell septation regulator SpoVG
MTPAAIEILDLRRTENAGNVRAFVSIRIGSVTIRDAKIIKQRDQRAWLAMPDKPWQGADGKTRYTAIIELSPSLKERVSDAALAAWEAQDDRAA